MLQIQKVFEKQQSVRWKVSQTSAQERIQKLIMLRNAVLANVGEMYGALGADLHKSSAEVDMTEIQPVLAEITHTIKHLKKWMKTCRVGTPLVLFGTKSWLRYEPKGVVLILAPWNYPVSLILLPLISAIAAGNCVVLKPSEISSKTSAFLAKFIRGIFDESEVALFEGGVDVSKALLDLPFDHIFFTGSTSVGKVIMAAAAKNLTSVTLELGGKSPAIVDETSIIPSSAERIMWGKFINGGQTCVAPDYLFVQRAILPQFLEESKRVIARFYGAESSARSESPDFCRIVSSGHYERLKKIYDETVLLGAKAEVGGEFRESERYIAPTLLTNVPDKAPIMDDEIFGPLLPILPYDSLDEVFGKLRTRAKPLALYIFSQNRKNIDRILENTTSGGTCINDTVVHLANPNLPFGGVGSSGMGNYHGVFGFKAFSHERAVLQQGRLSALRFLYPPYTDFVKKVISFITRYLS